MVWSSLCYLPSSWEETIPDRNSVVLVPGPGPRRKKVTISFTGQIVMYVRSSGLTWRNLIFVAVFAIDVGEEKKRIQQQQKLL